MKSIFPLLLLVLSLHSGLASESEGESVSSGSPSARVVILDVRTPVEFASGHIPGAINIPHDQIDGKVQKEIPAKETTVHLYCRSGRRSGIALEIMRELGYTDLTNKGGYKEFRAELEKESQEEE